MIAVQDVHGVDGILSDDVQIGFPHIGADEFDESTAFLPKPDEELTQTLLFPVLDDKQQPLHALVDLIDKRQELAPLPVDFIDPEGRDAGEIHPRPSPDHRHLDRAKYALPARLGRNLPSPSAARVSIRGQGGDACRAALHRLPQSVFSLAARSNGLIRCTKSAEMSRLLTQLSKCGGQKEGPDLGTGFPNRTNRSSRP